MGGDRFSFRQNLHEYPCISSPYSVEPYLMSKCVWGGGVCMCVAVWVCVCVCVCVCGVMCVYVCEYVYVLPMYLLACTYMCVSLKWCYIRLLANSSKLRGKHYGGGGEESAVVAHGGVKRCEYH